MEEGEEVQKIKVDEKGLNLAKTLVENLSGDFVPEEYTDEYSQVLLNIIKARAEGEEYTVEAKPEGEKVINLMEALQRSVEASKRRELPKKGMATAGLRGQEKEAKKKRKSG